MPYSIAAQRLWIIRIKSPSQSTIIAGGSASPRASPKLAEAPAIGVPTITMEGDANGAPHPEPSSYATKFSGKYQHRTIKGGVGHNLPQEAPQAFVKAIVEVAEI